jgi:hypothetical protein
VSADSYEDYLELWHAFPRANTFNYGPDPTPLPRAEWEVYHATTRSINLNILKHQNKIMGDKAKRAGLDRPLTPTEDAW